MEEFFSRNWTLSVFEFRFPFLIPESKDYIQAAASPRASGTHDGQDVSIYARGPMSHLLTGVHEQHYVNYVMTYASCVGRHRNKCGIENRRIIANAGVTSERTAMMLYIVTSINILGFVFNGSI